MRSYVCKRVHVKPRKHARENYEILARYGTFPTPVWKINIVRIFFDIFETFIGCILGDSDYFRESAVNLVSFYPSRYRTDECVCGNWSEIFVIIVLLQEVVFFGFAIYNHIDDSTTVIIPADLEYFVDNASRVDSIFRDNFPPLRLHFHSRKMLFDITNKRKHDTKSFILTRVIFMKV